MSKGFTSDWLQNALKNNKDLAARNPDGACGLATTKPQPNAIGSPHGESRGKEKGSQGMASRADSITGNAQGSTRIVVTIVAHLRRLMDDDNCTGGIKPLRDLIAREIGIDDGDSRITFQYGQVKTCGHEHTTVTVEHYTL